MACSTLWLAPADIVLTCYDTAATTSGFTTSMVIQAGGDSSVIDWQTFERQLISTFKPVNSKSIARHKLAYLKQTHSVFFSQILILGTIQAEMVTQWI